MKTLENHTIIYDAECPLCNAYTQGFIKYKMLDINGRTAFQQFDFDNNTEIDKTKAANKIVLFNSETNEITYGLPSLIKIIGFNYPNLAKLANISVIHFVLSLLYSFISYNRKMIAPSKITNENSGNPSINLPHRIAFIACCAILVHVIVTWYFQRFLLPFMHLRFNLPDVVLFLAQFPFQALVFYLFKQNNFYDYAGQLAFVSALAAFGLLIAGIAFKVLLYFHFDIQFLGIITYGAAFMFMFYEHLRRVKLYNWSIWICVSWIVFRLLIYPLVFKI